MSAFWVFLGGGLGSLARLALSSCVQQLSKKLGWENFPFGVLTCNLLGSFLIGLLFGFLASREVASWVYPLLGTGFLGGFTTFSTFSRDTHELWTSGLISLAMLKVLLSVLGGVVAVAAGIRFAPGQTI